MISLTRPAILAAGLGGACWTVKALVITVNDGSFDPLEGVFFIGGVIALVAAAVLVALSLARRLRGVARIAATIGGAVGLVAATVLIEQIGVNGIRAIAPGDNVGLEEEGGILLCGLTWLTLAVVAVRGERGPAPRAVTV